MWDLKAPFNTILLIKQLLSSLNKTRTAGRNHHCLCCTAYGGNKHLNLRFCLGHFCLVALFNSLSFADWYLPSDYEGELAKTTKVKQEKSV